MPEQYDDYIAISDAGTRKSVRAFFEILPEINGGTILDVGCGTGILLEKYAAKNSVMGIDNNSGSLHLASKKGIKTKRVDLEKKFDFENESFDLVICKDVLEFIINADQLFDEMIRVTKKRGLILLHVPNEFTLRDLVTMLFGKGLLKKRWYRNASELNNPHVRFFTRKRLIESALSKNLSIEKDYSAHWALPFPGASFLSKIMPHLFSPGITLLLRKP